MKRLNMTQQNKIIAAVLSKEPYKSEYDNKYHRLMIRAMLTEAMVLAVAVIQDGDEQKAQP